MYTFKGEHKFTDNWSLSGLYIYNKTDEPGTSIMNADKLFMADQDQWFGPLRRRPHVLVFNNTNVLNNTTVLSLRYGFSTWQDSCDAQLYSPGIQSIGFSPNFVNALGPGGSEVFPSLQFDSTEAVGGWGPIPTRWKGPYAINGALTKLKGTHSYKVGADFRRLGVALATENSLSGTYDFDPRFTSQNGTGGNEIASLLLGLPYQGSVPHDPANFEWFSRYWGVYFQDDWRVNSKFTLNYGIRFEHETGLQEVNNQQTVGFDPNVTNPIDGLVPKAGTPLAGQTLKGGLIFAGVNGANTYQGNPRTIKPAPRVGATYALDTKTVLRGGYGLFWAPWNYSTNVHGQVGFSRTTSFSQSVAETDVPLNTLDNPYPGGILPPVGSSLGLLTSVGGQVDYIDQNKANPKVQQYSVDIERELPGSLGLTLGYIGATGRDIGYCGTNDGNTCYVNINQVDPNLARQLYPLGSGWDAAKLRESVPNPFFGIAAAGELATQPTVPRAQLLRPFPEFADVRVHEMTAGSKRQYNAVSFQLDKRMSGRYNWLGGRYSYTYSNSKDNQFGESNTYAWNTRLPQNNYDLAAEYATSIYNSPHRIILAPIVRLPGPKDTKSMSYVFLGGWNGSAIIEMVSGSPLNAVMSAGASDSNLGLLGGRQRPNLTGDPNTTGSDEDRVSSALHPDARYFNAAAFTSPGIGQYGTAPRTIDTALTQFRKNVDLVFTKETRFGGNQVGEIRFEILNLTNTAKFGNESTNNAVNTSSFGRIATQAGFMRIWQLSFRYRF